MKGSGISLSRNRDFTYWGTFHSSSEQVSIRGTSWWTGLSQGSMILWFSAVTFHPSTALDSFHLESQTLFSWLFCCFTLLCVDKIIYFIYLDLPDFNTTNRFFFFHLLLLPFPHWVFDAGVIKRGESHPQQPECILWVRIFVNFCNTSLFSASKHTHKLRWMRRLALLHWAYTTVRFLLLYQCIILL